MFLSLPMAYKKNQKNNIDVVTESIYESSPKPVWPATFGDH